MSASVSNVPTTPPDRAAGYALERRAPGRRVRTELLWSTFSAVAVAGLLVTVPVGLLAWGVHAELDVLPGVGMEVLAAGSALAVLTAGAVLYVIVRRQSERLSAPLVRLAQDAARLGSGDPRIYRTATRIVEIDAVTDELNRSARRLLSSLSNERDFASDASHQLRTPLTALLMRLEEIAATDDLDVVREEVEVAIEQVERLTGTVDELLRRSRRTVGAPEPVRVDRVIAELQRLWGPQYERAGRVIWVSGVRGVQVWATDVALSQILGVLVENSLKYGGGTTHLDVRLSGPSIVIEVSDEGPGIAPDIAPFVFDKKVTTRGTGLGLSLARNLAEGCGGRLELVMARPVQFALFLSGMDD